LPVDDLPASAKIELLPRQTVQARAAEHLIRLACRRLPERHRQRTLREWSAELRAILHDPDTRLTLVRSARALSYAIGTSRTVRHPNRAAGYRGKNTRELNLIHGAPGSWANRSRRHPLIRPTIPDGVVFAVTALVSWLSNTPAAAVTSDSPSAPACHPHQRRRLR